VIPNTIHNLFSFDKMLTFYFTMYTISILTVSCLWHPECC